MGEPIKSVLVVGGGTAGWMAAAAIKRATGPTCEVRLVESAEIGIVGVGEATVPPIRDFNAMIDLDEAEFMRETKATLKLAIGFQDWGRLGHRYMHPFGTYGAGGTVGDFAQTWLMLRSKGMAEGLDAYSLCWMAAEKGKAALRVPDPRSPLNGLWTAYHFDAILYGRYLRKICEGRGIERIEGKIVEVVQRPEDGFIDSVKLEDGRSLAADLFIDCTGFRGLLIEGTLKAGYEDWSHWLPMNRAVAAPCARAEPARPYTMSTAREAGWQWRIDLQHRTGNGYVYGTDFISDQEAEDALVQSLPGGPLAEPRRLSFVTGTRKKHWDKNVVAMGLSSGFVEPLESTSLHMVQAAITRLLQHFPDTDFSPVNTDLFNRRLERENAMLRDFVILHYHLTERDDTPLWRHVGAMPIPDSLAERVEAFRDRGLLFQVGADEYFSQASWLSVLHGQGCTPRMHNPLYDLSDVRRSADAFARIRTVIEQASDQMPEHEAFLAQAGMLTLA